MTTDELLRLKKQVDEAKTKEAELTGKKKALLEQLKNEFGCNNIEEAEKKLDKMGDELDEMEEDIKKREKEIEEKLKNNGTNNN